MITTIQVEKQLKQRLDELRNYPGETYNQILGRLIESTTQTKEELSAKTIKNIQKSLADIKAGRVVSHEQVKRRLRLK